MFGQIRPQGKRLATLGTAEGLVRAVGLHVGPQVALVRKRFGADGTAEGLLAGVGAQVALQQPGPRKAFATKVASTPRAVGAQVHGQRGRAAVLAATGGALQFGGGRCSRLDVLTPLKEEDTTMGLTMAS